MKRQLENSDNAEQIIKEYIRTTFPKLYDSNIHNIDDFCQELNVIANRQMKCLLFENGKTYQYLEILEWSYKKNIKLLKSIRNTTTKNIKILNAKIYEEFIISEQLRYELEEKIYDFIIKESEKYRHELNQKIREVELELGNIAEQLMAIYLNQTNK